MQKRDLLTRTLAIAGTILAWFPLIAPVLLSLVMLVRSGMFRFDYLMPAELFPVAFFGGGLLLWAALRVHRRQRLIGWSLGVAIAALVGAQGLAVVTGLASGKTELGGWQWALVLALLALFWLALIAVAVGGLLLLRGRPVTTA